MSIGLLKGLVQKLNGRNRLVVVGALVILVATAMALSLESGGTRYVPLFSELEPKDAAEVIARLDEEQVPYRLSANGQTVEVPEESVHKMRIKLAQDGLPQSGVVGLEIMDKLNLGATDFDRRVQYLRAMQGELTRTIMQIDGVEKARVHLNVPEPSLFVRDRQPASASILLALRRGVTLEPSQIKGIMNLVAGSVEGLKSENVTVLDENGQLLSADVLSERKNSVRTASSNLKEQDEFQKEMEARLRGLLEPVFGAGNVVARVNAELNFNEQTVEKELFEPVRDGNGLIRSIQELQETFKGNGSPVVAGVPGVTSNSQIPTYPMSSGTGESQYDKRNAVKNYELNRTREQVVIAPGAVKRLSVSVLVNRKLTPAQKDAVIQTVNAAVGFDPDRRDQVVVTDIPFDTSLVDAVKKDLQGEGAKEQAEKAPIPVVYMVAAGVAGLVLIGGVILMVMARRRKERERQELEEQLEALRAAKQLQNAAGKKDGTAGQEKLPEPSVSGEPSEVAIAQSQVAAMAKHKPEEVAHIIRSWLNDN